MRMERLLSVLKGDAKKSIESVGKNGIFYATALKTLKRDFGNTFTVAYMKTKLFFDKPQLKHNDRAALKDFQQKLQCHITWLKSINYDSILKSPEYLTKAVRRLPNYLRQRFYNHSKDVVSDDSFITLEQFENWLEKRIKEQYNPIANILAKDEQHIKNKDSRFPINLNHSSVFEKDIKCWLCSEKHKITICEQFKSKNLLLKRNSLQKRKNCVGIVYLRDII